MLEPVTDRIWVVDGPEVNFYGFPYPTRMALVHLASGDLWVWSPIGLHLRLPRPSGQSGQWPISLAPTSSIIFPSLSGGGAFPRRACGVRHLPSPKRDAAPAAHWSDSDGTSSTQPARPVQLACRSVTTPCSHLRRSRQAAHRFRKQSQMLRMRASVAYHSQLRSRLPAALCRNPF